MTVGDEAVLLLDISHNVTWGPESAVCSPSASRNKQKPISRKEHSYHSLAT